MKKYDLYSKGDPAKNFSPLPNEVFYLDLSYGAIAIYGYKAIKYIRLSYTDDKTVESDSVANQRRLIDDYIARHPEIEVVAEKIDDGYSGVLFVEVR